MEGANPPVACVEGPLCFVLLLQQLRSSCITSERVCCESVGGNDNFGEAFSRGSAYMTEERGYMIDEAARQSFSKSGKASFTSLSIFAARKTTPRILNASSSTIARVSPQHRMFQIEPSPGYECMSVGFSTIRLMYSWLSE